MIWDYLTLLQDIHWKDLLDIALAAVLIWFGVHALRTMRTRKVGLVVFAFLLLILLANQLRLTLTSWILQGISAVIILVIVVVYQGEIRRLLERIPRSILARKKRGPAEGRDLTDILVATLDKLSGSRTGALIVLAGNEPFEGIISTGIALDARVSKALLLSIFDPNSPGHDGALVISGERAHSFGARLPLSDQEEPLRERGTRHAAALGLSERTDALVLVVSEENGRISIAREGRISPLAGPGQLTSELRAFLEQHDLPDSRTRSFRNWFSWGLFEGACGLLISAMLWLFVVAGAGIQTVTYEIPVEVQNIPEGYSLDRVTPERVAVSLTGGKRNFFKIRSEDLVIRLDGTLTRFGRQTFPITSAHLLLPPEIEIIDFAPEQVRVFVRTSE